jgi:hypothetical protein
MSIFYLMLSNGTSFRSVSTDFAAVSAATRCHDWRDWVACAEDLEHEEVQ